ncbi:hypothetical protein ACFV4K_16985 [Nocardia sp. NPDC059764]|uniref:hypothetical protein n=1 Tax=Nocardia sp. NPDC059764 TaxID=3346939 RepID=UPI003665CA57
MRLKNFTAVSALVIAAMGITAGTVNAAPAEEAGAIHYTATATETNSIIHTDAGSLVVENGVFEIKAANGTVVAGMPLSFKVNDFTFPIAAEISDRTATLTPQYDMAHATYTPDNLKDVALPYEDQAPWKSDYDRELAAWNRMKDTIGLGATVASLVGGLGGAAVGCAIGGVVFAAATAPLATMFGVGPLAGCFIGASTVGFLGTIAGNLFITAPVAIAAAIQYFTTINGPHIAPAPAK